MYLILLKNAVHGSFPGLTNSKIIVDYQDFGLTTEASPQNAVRAVYVRLHLHLHLGMYAPSLAPSLQLHYQVTFPT